MWPNPDLSQPVRNGAEMWQWMLFDLPGPAPDAFCRGAEGDRRREKLTVTIYFR